ncbi:MAG: hypothetical protein R2754_06480 [Microthrixaceae bacterium]
MHEAAVVALAYRYPGPDSLERLVEAVEALPEGLARRSMEHFIDDVGTLELGQWEELHTVTLDLSPQFVPYVGHVTWGENYRRGEFMADLKRDMERHNVDLMGELPDHIEPVLRYLAQVPAPLTDLTDVAAASVATMSKTLATAAPENPYRHVLAATHAVVERPTPVMIGVRR